MGRSVVADRASQISSATASPRDPPPDAMVTSRFAANRSLGSMVPLIGSHITTFSPPSLVAVITHECVTRSRGVVVDATPLWRQWVPPLSGRPANGARRHTLLKPATAGMIPTIDKVIQPPPAISPTTINTIPATTRAARPAPDAIQSIRPFIITPSLNACSLARLRSRTRIDHIPPGVYSQVTMVTWLEPTTFIRLYESIPLGVCRLPGCLQSPSSLPTSPSTPRSIPSPTLVSWDDSEVGP